MALIVPYRSPGTAAQMVQRTMTTAGTRDAGRRPGGFFLDPRRVALPVTRVRGDYPVMLGDLCCPDCEPATVNYGAAKRLGALGAAAFVGQTMTGVKAGTTAAGVSTAVGTGVASAIGAGAAAGSVVPIIGTAIGAIVGLLASGVLNHRTDPEVANFNEASALYRQNRLSVLNIADKYLVLAGLFDLLPSQIKGNIPIYKKYGRMGEGRFVTDMCAKIYQAAQSGQITASDTPTSILNRVVQPWIDSFGFGQMSDSNQDMITLIILGMIADYVTGNQRSWFAVGGDNPFTSLPPFRLPASPQLPAPVQVQAAPAAQVPVLPSGVPAAGALCAAPYVWNGSQCVLPGTAPGTVPTAASCAPPYVWNGSQCVIPNNALPTSPAVAPQSNPTGLVSVGYDASGNQIFANPQGVLYSPTANGGFQIFSGQLASNSSPAAQMQAALQNALAQGQSAQQAAAAALQQAQASGVVNTPQLQQQVAAQVGATQAAPIQPTTAGLGGGGVLGWVSAGAAVLGLIFATARPAKGTRHA